MAQKAKKKSKLRHAEYYDMQKTFDSLYADSKSGEVFGHLMDIISAPNNIKLAFRNIKGNDGSHTAGTDGRTIESLAVMSEDKFVKLIQKQFRRYEPKAVKRVEIPKPNGKMRHPIPTESVRYNDNRVSLYAGQDGKCAITGKKLDVQTCICYRKTNNCKKGNDSYQNLLLLSLQGLAIVSSEDMMSVAALVKEYSLNAKVITKVNKLRATAGLPLLAAK
ncbi:MAG: hypothetical protein ACLUI0_07545 [Blautia massiliensis (ex Durand et al. 2017)]